MRTVTGLSHQPFATAAAAAATALEPEALVSPAPRSQTSTVSSFGPSTRTSWTFVRSGKRSFVSISGPSRSSSSRLGVAPHDRVRVADRHRGQLDPLAVELDRLGLPHLDLPDAHRDRPVVADAAGYARPATAIVTWRRRRRAPSQAAAIRLPLPENSATEPSGFQITISACAPSARDHLEHAVGADAVTDVAEPAGGSGSSGAESRSTSR